MRHNDLRGNTTNRVIQLNWTLSAHLTTEDRSQPDLTGAERSPGWLMVLSGLLCTSTRSGPAQATGRGDYGGRGAVGEDGGGQRRWLPEDGRVAEAWHLAAEVGGLSMSSMATAL